MYYYNNIGKIRNIGKLKKYMLSFRQLYNNNLHEKNISLSTLSICYDQYF